VSQVAFDDCATANKEDRSKIFLSRNYVEFLVYKYFHGAVTEAFDRQLRRSRSNWRVEFSKALPVSIREDFKIELGTCAEAAYHAARREKGADLALEDVLKSDEVVAVITSLKMAMFAAAGNTQMISNMGKTIDACLCKSFRIRQPNVLLVTESQTRTS